MTEPSQPSGDSMDWFVPELEKMRKEKAQSEGMMVKLQRRRISDDIFRTLNAAILQMQDLALRPGNEWLKENLTVPMEIIGEQDIQTQIPPTAAISLTAASKLALEWKSIPEDQEDAVREKTVSELMQELVATQSFDDLFKQKPYWRGVMDAIINDVRSEGAQNINQMVSGLDEEVLESDTDFLVNVHSNSSQQIAAVAEGIVHRIRELCSPGREAVLREMEGWRKWRSKLEKARREDISKMVDVYQNVRVPFKTLMGLVSIFPESKKQAEKSVEDVGGFLHDPDMRDFEEMIDYGVTAVLRAKDVGKTKDTEKTITAYYGVLTDPRRNLEHMMDLCGYDPHTDYHGPDVKLPGHSRKGWLLNWINRKAALQMFREIDEVAVSVEVAVKAAHNAARPNVATRNSGIAAALKYFVYEQVPQQFILTRHFEIREVNGIAVPSVFNWGSGRFIQTLGGKPIGTAEEEFDLSIPDSQGKIQKVHMNVSWHYSLAQRKTSIERIEQKGRK